MPQQLGVIGLGTMGANLARNAARNGDEVVLFNRTTEKTASFMERYGEEGKFLAAKTLAGFVKALRRPRTMLLMVKAGGPVDDMLRELLPHLQRGDSVIDAGNSHYRDTERRQQALRENGIAFIGMGVSGGEEGALKGPSMMPGGDSGAVQKLLPLLKKMAADDGDGGACVTYVGPGGAGHFVKMVHNGIEYGLMQLIAESYDLLKGIGKMKNKNLAQVYEQWGRSGDLGSFLIEITAKIFLVKDSLRRGDLIDAIADSAGQKGTGRWTTDAAMELGIAIPTINAAVDARILSGEVERRARLQRELPEALLPWKKMTAKTLIGAVRCALELSTICTYAQGFELMAKASSEYRWNLQLAEIARIWKGGCIIRSKFLHALQQGQLGKKAAKQTILKRLGGSRQRQWRDLVALGVARGVPLPAMSASLWFYDALRSERLPQNLVAAQRDFFGAHGYERVDRAGVFHSQWNV